MDVTREETIDQKEAFKNYYQLGLSRSYSKVALKMGKSISTIEKWGSQFNWTQKVEELDKKVKDTAEEKSIVEQEVDFRQRNLRIVKRSILDHAKALQEGKLKPSFSILMDLIRLEEELRTGITGRLEVNHKFEIKGLSNEELAKKILEKTTNLKKFMGLKPFKDLEDPIVEAEFKEVKDE